MDYHTQYGDDIFKFCMVKTRNRDTALEATQETFMKFWEYLAKGTTIGNHRALLYKIANNYIIDSYRKKKDVNVEDYSTMPFYESLSHNPQQRMEDHIDGTLALTLLKELPPLISEIVTLKLIDDLSISEISSVVGRDNKTVSVYLHRGIKMLQERITSYEQ